MKKALLTIGLTLAALAAWVLVIAVPIISLRAIRQHEEATRPQREKAKAEKIKRQALAKQVAEIRAKRDATERAAQQAMDAAQSQIKLKEWSLL